MQHLRLSILCVSVLGLLATGCATPPPTHTGGRIDQDINQNWRFIRSDPDAAKTPAFDDSAWQIVTLPHTWNTEIAADGKSSYYHGPVWYRSHLEITPDLAGKCLFLRFGAASQAAEVFINGEIAGTHEGGFSAFCVDATRLLHPGDNVIAVRADNRLNKNISPLSGDFTTRGGLYRGVRLLALDPVSISPLDDSSSGVYFQTQVSDASADVTAKIELRNATDSPVPVSIRCTVTNAAGSVVQQASKDIPVPASATTEAVLGFTVDRPHLWNGRADPYLYAAAVEVRRGNKMVDRVMQPIAFRYFKVDPQRGLFLNGKPYDFHGVNYHEGRSDNGFKDSPEMEEQDNRLICDMGCTGVRMAHYQHNDYEYTLCDRAGLLVWTELALVNKISDTPEFRANVNQQLRELIKQNYNHPSILFWSMYNEPWVSKEAGTEEQWHLIADLVAAAHELDPTRTTTGAAMHVTKGPVAWYMDVTGFNYYYGWYEGVPTDWPRVIAQARANNPGKNVGISEYGAGASVTQHETNLVRPTPASRWHPEEWQGIVHENAWPAMAGQQWMWCKLVWCMFDFEAAWRNEGDTTGMNDKGLVTADRKVCKDAYYYYKACWNPEPFVYITDRRFLQRPVGPALLKVYSNCQSVELFLNGRSLGVKANNNNVFVWQTSLSDGEVEATCQGNASGRTFKDSTRWTVSAAFQEPSHPAFVPKSQ